MISRLLWDYTHLTVVIKDRRSTIVLSQSSHGRKSTGEILTESGHEALVETHVQKVAYFTALEHPITSDRFLASSESRNDMSTGSSQVIIGRQ